MLIKILNKMIIFKNKIIPYLFFSYLKYVKKININIPKDIVLIGFPIIEAHKNSSIYIGDNCVIVSKKYSNPLGLKGRTIIRTLGENARISIGNEVGMSGATICSMKSISIGNLVSLGANTVIVDNDFHPSNPWVNKQLWDNIAYISKKEVIIKNNIITGMNVLILKGAIINEGSYIGACSIVYKEIPKNSLVVNSEARIIKDINKKEECNKN